MTFSTERLLKEYIDWYESRFSIKELSRANEIITPFVNHLNDRIALYIKPLSNNQIQITDDGVTLQELEMMGLTLTPTRERILDGIKRDFGVSQTDEILYVVADSAKDFPQKKHNLLQAVLKVYDLLFVLNTKVKNMFNEDVYEYLYENDFGGTKADLTGRSGIKYPIDYVLGEMKNRPYTIIQFFNDPKFEKVAAQSYIYEDLQKVYGTKRAGIKYVIVANDEKKIPEKSLIVAQDIGVELIPWKDRERLLDLR